MVTLKAKHSDGIDMIATRDLGDDLKSMLAILVEQENGNQESAAAILFSHAQIGMKTWLRNKMRASVNQEDETKNLTVEDAIDKAQTGAVKVAGLRVSTKDPKAAFVEAYLKMTPEEREQAIANLKETAQPEG